MQKKTVAIEYANMPLIVSGDYWPAMPPYKAMFETDAVLTAEGSDIAPMIEALGDWDDVHKLCCAAVEADMGPHREAA